ncbi:hypothetical protein A1QO_02830 [Vibrio genomosp. F10 str. ZF-129]|uniref:Uncharacterized protein n=1 Tax=Vibrio genomosp. F10 str. ZF-129 TaxID=1187848 RepID=A0A1E5BKD6_9VIBR|nr:hypothetical protein [Vibrio genomosp. F10]OEE38331.1 hypothetical protein A1QO_02830 [Vibrio genomosp. F10 str. ZF-129]
MAEIFKVGSTEVRLELDTWNKHGRLKFMVSILCVDSPFSDYDSLRFKPSLEETKEVIDWIIENEGKEALKGYTVQQIQFLCDGINKLVEQYI